ncbi:MAG: Type I restriction-modification system, specificity subunit S [Ktedonobacterales bacterium]|jgi:type I restriction enzyme S subunit|nr:MAG: Type I restriction-modification system, specificity subunit S [Ktedonobacterales bacterium]
MATTATTAIWKSVEVAEIAANVKHALAMGPFGSRITKDNFIPFGVPVIRGTNIAGDRFSHDDLVYISEEKADELRASNAYPDDLVFTHRGTLGQVGLIPRGQFSRYVVSQSQMKLTCDESKVLPAFLYYYFRSEFGQHELLSHAGGSGVPAISSPLTTLKSAQVRFPPLPIQRKIAAILSAYDDLIENNTRRIALLEDLARTLYREWFVHFRFPGHAAYEMTDSPFGPIPSGWQMATYADLLDLTLGGDWGSGDPTAEDTRPVTVIRGTDFDDIRLGNHSRAPVRFISERSLKARTLRPGDLIVENSVNANSRTIGKSLLITSGILRRLGGDVICASFCKLFRPKEPQMGPLMHLHLKYLHDEGRMAFYQNVATNGIGNFQATRFVQSEYLALPNDKSLRALAMSTFSDLTSSNLADTCDTLRRTRDLLLPKLISGELDVEHIAIEIGD